MCTLLRCIDNETNAKVVKPNEILEEAQELLKPRGAEPSAEERLGTEGDQDEDYGLGVGAGGKNLMGAVAVLC